jgi:hypothetical protein
MIFSRSVTSILSARQYAFDIKVNSGARADSSWLFRQSGCVVTSVASIQDSLVFDFLVPHIETDLKRAFRKK